VGPTSVLIGDVDRDGRADLLVPGTLSDGGRFNFLFTGGFR
jgi:hypothetical protein